MDDMPETFRISNKQAGMPEHLHGILVSFKGGEERCLLDEHEHAGKSPPPADANPPQKPQQRHA